MSSNGVINVAPLLEETVHHDASNLRDAETRYQEYLANVRHSASTHGDVSSNPYVVEAEEATPTSSLASEIANVRSRIQNFMRASDSIEPLFPGRLVERIQLLEQENATYKKKVDQMSIDMKALIKRVNLIDIQFSLQTLEKKEAEKSAVKTVDSVIKTVDSVVKNGTVDEDDDVDLFGSDEETEEDRRIKEERLKAYEIKKAKKAQVIAKSSVVLDVKPWSDETDLKEMEVNVRKIESAGLKWGAAKLVPLAYGIKKLQIIAIVEDDNCSIDWLQEQIEAIEDLVQSVDIAAFNKL